LRQLDRWNLEIAVGPLPASASAIKASDGAARGGLFGCGGTEASASKPGLDWLVTQPARVSEAPAAAALAKRLRRVMRLMKPTCEVSETRRAAPAGPVRLSKTTLRYVS